jgi:hypothetical protein
MRFSLVFLFALIIGKTFSQGSFLVIFSEHGEKFTVELNGTVQNDQPGSRVQMDGLYTPSFKVKVTLADVSQPPLLKTIFNKPSGEIYYVLKKDAKGNYILESTTHDWSGEVIKEEEHAAPPPPPDQKVAPTGATKQATSGCSNPMNDVEFQIALESVSRQPFDGPKLGAAKNLAKKNCLLASQVRDVIYTFSYEPAKLDFAKFAYVHTFDPGNYNEVKDALSPASQEALEKYLESLPK